ncbi:MAG: helix-turn-helix domain-containing protein [Pseudomonadota bacterium]|nr:helix-turn-helix domain-containing protein [Pseudomonadota bacterium]
MEWDRLEDEFCSLARTLSVVGDRWTLIILRDCFRKVRRFDDFRERLGIAPHVLSARLKKLVAAGVLRRVVYDDRLNRHEYVLTDTGLDLHPVVMAMVRWGDRHMTDDRGRPVRYRHRACGALFDPVTVCSVCHEPVAARDVTAEPASAGAPPPEAGPPRAPRPEASRP